MNIIVVVIMVALIILIGYFINQRSQKQTEQAVLHCLPVLHAMIGQLQKHRGMNAGFLQGSKDVKPTLDEIKRKLTAIKSDLDTYPIMQNMERWLSFSDHWSRLSKNSDSLTIASSFQQHTAMIENLLYLLEDLADCASTLLSNNVDRQERINLLWRDLPLMVECIGQTRAVGMAVATRGDVTQIDKIKLSYLTEKIDSISIRVFAQLGDDPTFMSAKSVCENFVNMVHDAFIQQSKVTIQGDTYFTVASNTMDILNTIINAEIQIFTSN